MSPEQAKAQPLDGRSDLYSLGVVAYQCLTGGVPFDGEDSFSIGYKHIMEEIPTPALEHPEKRQLFEIIRKMMAKLPQHRFQNADELIGVLEGGRSVTFTTDATQAMASMSGGGGPRIATAPTTPLPRATGTRPPVPSGAPVLPVPEQPRRSVLAGLLVWLLIVGAVFGGGGFYAYKQGLIFAKSPGGGGDSARAPDTTRLAAADSTKPQAGDTSAGVAPPAEPPPPPAGAPGRLLLQGVPAG